MPKVKREELPREYQEIWDELIMEVDTNISFDDVILSEDNKSKYNAFIKEQLYKEKLREYGLQSMNRLLLYGASGTGKTYSLKALSNKLDYTMIYIDIAKALTNADVAMNISNVFKLANYIAAHYGGAVLLMDECDAVAVNRDSNSPESGTIRRATNSIFQYVDQMNPDIIFCAATNMLHRLDAAFERRFNLKLEFRRPQQDLDESIHHFMNNKFIYIDDVNENVREIVKKRAKQYVKLSYFEIQGIVERAMKNAILNDSIEVRSSEIYQMLADNMNFKIKFDTALDKEEIFHNNNHYDPSMRNYY